MSVHTHVVRTREWMDGMDGWVGGWVDGWIEKIPSYFTIHKKKTYVHAYMHTTSLFAPLPGRGIIRKRFLADDGDGGGDCDDEL